MPRSQTVSGNVSGRSGIFERPSNGNTLAQGRPVGFVTVDRPDAENMGSLT
jgi:hypothetical protein